MFEMVIFQFSSYDAIYFFIEQVGVLPMDESKVIMKGRLGPGMMITVDLEKGEVCIIGSDMISYSMHGRRGNLFWSIILKIP
jgi:hypothetical protein